jgi:hypothetical protein
MPRFQCAIPASDELFLPSNAILKKIRNETKIKYTKNVIRKKHWNSDLF